MKLHQRITRQLAFWVLERPARRRTLAEHARRLEASGEQLTRHLQTVAESPTNRDQLRHIIGIESWAQHRLRSLLGEPLVLDEYDDFRPAASTSWNDLRAALRATRAATVALVHQIDQTQLDPDTAIPHNQYGPITVRAWLRYLTIHASLESKRIR